MKIKGTFSLLCEDNLRFHEDSEMSLCIDSYVIITFYVMRIISSSSGSKDQRTATAFSMLTACIYMFRQHH